MKTLVASFPDFETARAAVDELVEARFDRSQISIIASDADGRFAEYSSDDLRVDDATNAEPDGSDVASGAGIGAAIGGVGGLLVGLIMLPIPGIGPVLAAGPIAAALAGAGLGAAAGGLLGALTELGVPEEQAGAYAESVRRGDVLVTATVPDVSADQADHILQRAGRADTAQSTDGWSSGDWQRLDSAGEGSADESERAEEYAQMDAARHTGAIPRPIDDFGSTLAGAAAGADEVVVATPDDAVVAPPAALPIDTPAGIARAYAATEMAEESARADAVDDIEDDAATGAVDSETENAWRVDHAERHSDDGEPYAMYRRAYFYGYQLSQDHRFHGRAWGDMEADVSRDWEAHNYGPWARFKDAVRHAWERVGG